MAEITDDRSCALVGRFTRDWAFTESKLDDVIATALKIGSLESWVISTTIPVAKKWAIVETLITISEVSDEDKKSIKELKVIFDRLNGVRNMMAHCRFFPTTDGTAVRFLRLASNGKLRTSRSKERKDVALADWSEDEFETCAQKMVG